MAVLLVIGIILVVLWLLGLVSAFTLGGFIHVALVIGLILVIIWAITSFRAAGFRTLGSGGFSCKTPEAFGT